MGRMVSTAQQFLIYWSFLILWPWNIHIDIPKSPVFSPLCGGIPAAYVIYFHGWSKHNFNLIVNNWRMQNEKYFENLKMWIFSVRNSKYFETFFFFSSFKMSFLITSVRIHISMIFYVISDNIFVKNSFHYDNPRGELSFSN